MQKRIAAILSLSLVAGAACAKAAPPKVTGKKSPAVVTSPTAIQESNFTISGVVIEASGSAGSTVSATVSGSAGRSPSPSASASAKASVSPTAHATVAGGNTLPGAPGSIALKLAAIDGAEGDCPFSPGDVLVVVFTSATIFEPSELTAEKAFPNNLKGKKISAEGFIKTLSEEGDCIFVVASVKLEARTSPSAKTTTKSSPSPSRSASPTPRATTSP